MEMSLAKRLLVSAFSFLAKYCSISSRNLFALWPSEIEPRNAFGIERLMIIRHIRLDRSHFLIFTSLKVSRVEMGHFVFSAKSKSMQPKTISTASFHTLKFVPFSIRIEFTWVVTFVALAILTKKRTKINNMFTNNQAIHIKYI